MFGEVDDALRGPLEASPRPGVPAAGSIPSRKRKKGTLLTDQRVFNQSSKERLYREFQVFLSHWSENQFVTPLHMEDHPPC